MLQGIITHPVKAVYDFISFILNVLEQVCANSNFNTESFVLVNLCVVVAVVIVVVVVVVVVVTAM